MRNPDIARYAEHSRWSDPGPLGSHLDAVPADPGRLPEIVSGLVLHPLFTATAANPSTEPDLRRIADILAALLAKDGRPLTAPREPQNRGLWTCRDYALLACAVLRHHHVPARLRVGFADYFTPGFWEDHWVCEYHDGSAWRLLDAELAPEVRHRFGLAFDPADVPRDRFVTAALAWRAVQRGQLDESRFGVSVFGLAGLWFVAGSLLRDLAALSREEMMPWDYWGLTRNLRPGDAMPEQWLESLDGLAAALARAPDGYDDVRAIIAAHPWAALTPGILSFPAGEPVEIMLDRYR